ncbi:ABC transporter permease [Serpentinicella sp. ANB-PHB4]|uniref:ABC transporter permease n=1 Tax=Serpentinicella sp. ANB-PHB4 TaxID=3074076 RepID=UPI00285F20E5|nr:ABC transporter permease [Serpentinicella sp. ANB-PHB4]MDR5658464.1 ABC transporter permease [Serpentinicella sp. ANB-PHB4]
MALIGQVFQLYNERREFFLGLIVEHFILTVTAVFIITCIGLITGILMIRNAFLAKVILRLTSFLYTIPSIALFGFLVAITGIGYKSAIIALVLYGILPIIRNTYVGLSEIDEQIIESAIAMGSTSRQMLFRIRLPLALPIIFSGFRTMVIMTIALGAIASFIGAGGLGDAIWRGITTNFPAMTIAGSLLIAVMAIVTDLILELIEKRLRERILGKV